MEVGEDVQAQLGALNANIKAIFKRLDDQTEMQKNLYRLTTSVELIAKEQSGMADSIKCLRSDVDDIKMKPAKRWESVVMGGLGAFVVGVVGFVLGKLGI